MTNETLILIFNFWIAGPIGVIALYTTLYVSRKFKNEVYAFLTGWLTAFAFLILLGVIQVQWYNYFNL